MYQVAGALSLIRVELLHGREITGRVALPQDEVGLLLQVLVTQDIVPVEVAWSAVVEVAVPVKIVPEARPIASGL